jgi:hypothetical protein
MSRITVNSEKARTLRAPEVKAECRRRILAIMSEDEQRNTLAAGQAATMQHGPDPAKWPKKQRDRQFKAMTAWAEIERLRARSNEVEAMEPIPAYLGDDALWAT